jgi:diguanylate cyclase (GGDEF)-like protein
MPHLPPPKVLIFARNVANQARWADHLADTSATVWKSTAEVPPGERVEVLVTDFDSAAELGRCGGPKVERGASEQYHGVAVIGMGACDWGDLRLKEDCPADELAVACTLLAEVARLRVETARAAELQRTISQLAYTDPLTSLPNRRAWDVQLAARLGPTRSPESVVWLAIIDLDGFKQVNDAHGLSAGDDALRRIGSALARALRRGDVIARLGGDEFGVLLSGVDEASAARVFDRLCAAAAIQTLPLPGKGLTVSIGYASTSASSDGAELFVAAERALKRAKAAGGNRAVHFASAQ